MAPAIMPISKQVGLIGAERQESPVPFIFAAYGVIYGQEIKI